MSDEYRVVDGITYYYSSLITTHHSLLITHHSSLILKLLAQPLIHYFGIRFAFGSLHHLAHEKPEQCFLARAILLELIRIGGNYFINDAVDFAGVADLNQTALFDDRRGRLARRKHFDQNVFSLFAADFSFVDQAYQRT